MFRNLISTPHNTVVLCVSALLLFLSCAHNVAAFDTDPFYDRRGTLSVPTYDAITEHIDPFSGNMLIVHTDLHLPGKAGLDLNLTRSYNSLIYGYRNGTSFPQVIASYDKSPVGLGWSMHMGILRNPPYTGTSSYPYDIGWGNNPVFELPDGTKQIFFPTVSIDTNDHDTPYKYLRSKDFWILKAESVCDYMLNCDWEINAPDGTVYKVSTLSAGYKTSELTGRKNVAQVISIQNAAGTAKITVDYKDTTSTTVIDKITDSVGRIITFKYNSSTSQLDSITTDTRTIKYYQDYLGLFDSIAAYALKTVEPPVGPSWRYEYDSNHELSAITYPAGGKVTYAYDDRYFSVGGCPTKFKVIATKQTQLIRGIPNGTWTYTYSSGGGSGDVTTVTAPNSVTEKYTYYGWGNVSSGSVWKVGLPIKQEFNYNGVIKTDEFFWTKPLVPISDADISNITWGCSGSVTSDTEIYPAYLDSQRTTKDGKSYYETDFSNFNDYGDPQTITETGDGTRTKNLTYCINTSKKITIAKNIVKGKPKTETVTGSFPGTSTASWTYGTASDCINVTETTQNGVTTQYSYYPAVPDIYDRNSGNLKTVTNANGHPITYEWQYGKKSKESNAIYYIWREINVDGTVKSETNGKGDTTSYAYDKNLRLTTITPPNNVSPSLNPTVITYASDNSSRTESRGNFSTTYTLDGFGRTTASSDTKGVTTSTVYLAYGTKNNTDSNIGDKTDFDFFGRPVKITDKDNYTETYNYAAVSNRTTTTITDKNNQQHKLTYTAFGNPDEKYLMSVYDPEYNLTSYERNILGNATKTTQATQAGSVIRNYTYETNKIGFLASEAIPEQETVYYTRYNAGNIHQKTDANGTATYAYDVLDRLTSITKNSQTVSFEYDNANNRTRLTSGDADIRYTYDAANRLKTKTETIVGKTYLTSYGYTANDIISSITYPSGRVVNYGINTNNQVSSITGFVTNVIYNSSGSHAGLPDNYTLDDAQKSRTTLMYNNRQLITKIDAGSALTASYGYDSRGNTTSLTSNLANPQTFGYDNLSRLTSFSGAWGSGSFSYDSVGNRKTKNGGSGASSYTYNSSTNRLTSTTGSESATYIYNNVGALSNGNWGGVDYTLEYNAFDNLTSYKAGSTTLASFRYDGDGIRVTKTSNNKTVVSHYDQSGNTISETDGNGTLIADYILLNGKLIAKVLNIPKISAAPTSSSFGNVFVNQISTAHTFTIMNTGTAELVLGTISSVGTHATEFTLQNDNCSGHSVVPQASCTIQVVFAPTTTGAKSASLSIPSNDPITPLLTLSLNGTALLPTLSVTLDGTGLGMVTSQPGGIYCGTACSAEYPTSSSVILEAAEGAYSSFIGWSGACSGTTPCTLTMDDNKGVTATFDYQATKVDGTFYQTLQDAYNHAVTGDTIYVWDETFNEGLVCNQPIDVTILGGYDKVYSSVTGTTKLTQPIEIQQGSLTVSDITIAEGSSVAAVSSLAVSSSSSKKNGGPALILNKKKKLAVNP